MSRVFQSKNKELVNLDVKKSKDVWCQNKQGKYILNDKFNYYGKIDKNLSNFVTMTNKQGLNVKFVEDTHKLPKKTKNEIVKNFNNAKTQVVYLVKKK